MKRKEGAQPKAQNEAALRLHLDHNLLLAMSLSSLGPTTMCIGTTTNLLLAMPLHSVSPGQPNHPLATLNADLQMCRYGI